MRQTTNIRLKVIGMLALGMVCGATAAAQESVAQDPTAQTSATEYGTLTADTTYQRSGDKTLMGRILDRTFTTVKAAARGVEFNVRAGGEIGGTSPVPLPAEIRKIKSFNPRLNLYVEGDLIATIKQSDFGILLGVRWEQKSMKTDARVKAYNMRMDGGDGTDIEGPFTGEVKTKVANSYLTIPLLATWQVSDRWRLKLGPYYSLLLGKDFSGTAYNGYIREGNPTGGYVEVTSAGYDFSGDLRRNNIGIQFGADWLVLRHLLVGVDLDWGLNNIFKKNFEVVTFNMFPIYGMIGLGYVF